MLDMFDNEIPKFGLRFEGKQMPWPTDLGAEPKSWKDTVFTSSDIYEFVKPSFWNEVVIGEGGTLYAEYHTLELEMDSSSAVGYRAETKNMNLISLEDFTGQINFEAFIQGDEDKDYYFNGVMKVVDGKFCSISFRRKDPVDNSPRKLSEKETYSRIQKRIRLVNSSWYKFVYCPYHVIIRGLFRVVCFIWNIPLLILNKLVGFITPF